MRRIRRSEAEIGGKVEEWKGYEGEEERSAYLGTNSFACCLTFLLLGRSAWRGRNAIKGGREEASGRRKVSKRLYFPARTMNVLVSRLVLLEALVRLELSGVLRIRRVEQLLDTEEYLIGRGR